MIEVTVSQQNAKQQATNALKGSILGNVIVCIGTEKVVCDSLGPRVGTLINENMPKPLTVYGLQNANITAENLADAFAMIKRLHPHKKLIVVDAAVGEASQVGKVQICNGSIVPGAATNKNLATVGDVSIVGIVSSKDMSDFYCSSCEKQLLVEKLSQFIASTILMATKL